MAFEILSAKIYTPFLGASIYVWTAILTVTLLGLAVGYRVGGYLSQKESSRYLSLSFFIAGILVFLSTNIANFFLPMFLTIEIKMAALFSGFVILFFPVLFMGIISPLIVKQLNTIFLKISQATGIVYSIGTIGGIVFVVATVYWLIPNMGVKQTSFLLGILLIFVGIVLTFLKFPAGNEKK